MKFVMFLFGKSGSNNKNCCEFSFPYHPWDWYTYLGPTFGIIWLDFMANVGKHASPMAHGWYEFGCILGEGQIRTSCRCSTAAFVKEIWPRLDLFDETKPTFSQKNGKILWMEEVLHHWVVVSNIFYIFTPNLGEMIQFDEYFSNGLKPPTRLPSLGIQSPNVRG